LAKIFLFTKAFDDTTGNTDNSEKAKSNEEKMAKCMGIFTIDKSTH
jgi:hypothetical protein